MKKAPIESVYGLLYAFFGVKFTNQDRQVVINENGRRVSTGP